MATQTQDDLTKLPVKELLERAKQAGASADELAALSKPGVAKKKIVAVIVAASHATKKTARHATAPKRLSVKMLTSLSGEGVSLVTGQTYELPAGFAHALCSDPVEAPRAEPVGWEVPGEAVAAAQKRFDADRARIERDELDRRYRAGLLDEDETDAYRALLASEAES